MNVRALILGGVIATIPTMMVVQASDIQSLTEFTAGGPIRSSEMNGNFATIKSAVNDSQVQIDTLETELAAIKSGGSTCAGNNAIDVMVKIGTLCVDKFKASLWDANTDTASPLTTMPGTCATNGTTCSGVVAQSRESPGAAVSSTLSFAQAIQACGNAGKRLLTVSEWLLAFGSGQITDIATVETLEFIDYGTHLRDPIGNGPAPVSESSPVQGTYIGTRTIANGRVQMFSNVDYDAVTGKPFIGFRCAR